jgi:hypothetical protein
MKRFAQLCFGMLAVAAVSLALASSARAATPRSDVVRPVDIQASIDQKVDGEAADREAVRALLRRPDVRRIAGAAGLNVDRASVAVGQLSGSQLEDLAARVDEINATPGGRQSVTIGVTTLIIVLLLIIIIAK